MKLWDKGTSVNKVVEEFTIGRDKELDILLAEFDVLGSLAHIRMLESIGLLKKTELKILTKELLLIYQQIKKGSFKIDQGTEDVHSQIEFLLTKKLGDVGKKIHSGRSRNDQVLVDLKLFIRSEIRKTVVLLNDLFNLLIVKSNENKNVLMPGYTHMQVAMPSSFGLWFGAYAESLSDDMIMLNAAYKIANQNPLGSGAGYGSSFPLNRKMTTDLLGFENMNYNVVYAQMTRGKTERITAQALSSAAATMSKLAADVCLYMSQNFGFVTLPDEYTTGSSIMPHKKNPDVFELIRAKCNRIQALPNEITMIINNLSSGYHRDLQIVKECIIPAFLDIQFCILITQLMLSEMKVNENILDDEKYKFLFSVEEVNTLVLQGMPFRDAYKKVGKSIADNKFNPSKKIKHTHEGSIGNLCNKEIQKKMDSVMKQFNFKKTDDAIEILLKNKI